MKFKTTRGITENFLKNKHPEYYEKMFEFVDSDITNISEKMWLFQNSLKEPPTCLNCNEHKVKFIKFSQGYRKFCSRKCSIEWTNKNEKIKNKRLSGIKKWNKNKKLKKIITEKSNKTKSNFSEQKKLQINKKRENTNLKKWGVKNISESDEIKKLISNQLKEKLPNIHKERVIERIKSLNFEIINIEKEIFSLKCPKCNEVFSISRSLFNQRSRFNIEQCLICNPNNNDSDFEKKIYNFIKENYEGVILGKHRKYRKYEIDVYLPDMKVGFECNGLYWHSELYKEKNYHSNKTDFFSKEGIKIIHIWEDDWKFKNEIIKSRILNLLNKTPRKIWGRKTKIEKVTDNKLVKDFLNTNHLQGYIPSKYKIGLFYGDELVSLMTFGSLRINLGSKNKKDHYELLRFCNKLNTNVVGGASKLLNYFLMDKKPIKIISYASRDWSNGNLYQTLKFKKVRTTPVNYFYFNKDEGIRHNRFKFRKDVLVKEGNSPKETEHSIMNNKGYYRIYDTGSLLYEKF